MLSNANNLRYDGEMQIPQDMALRFEAELRRHGLKITRLRSALFGALYGADAPRSIQELAQELPWAHFVSVYRSVDALLKAEVIKQVPQGFKNRFELNDMFRPHHHHATCEQCNRTQQVDDKRLEALMRELTLEAGLVPTRHHFEIYGVCRHCAHGA